MKRWFLFAISSFIVLGWLLRRPLTPAPAPVPVLSPTPTPSFLGKPFTYLDQPYRYLFYELSVHDKTSLIANYEHKIYASSLIANKTCSKIFTGGFYDTKAQPLGQIVIDHIELAPYRASTLFNGFLIINPPTLTLSAVSPVPSTVSYALQSGPLLLRNGRIQPLNLNRDKFSRRTLIVQTDQSQIIFMAVFNPEIPFGGPRLQDLPAITQNLCRDLSVSCQTALNLDGGGASVFYLNSTVFLREAEPVGSFICLN